MEWEQNFADDNNEGSATDDDVETNLATSY
jgi:hypothetical protein